MKFSLHTKIIAALLLLLLLSFVSLAGCSRLNDQAPVTPGTPSPSPSTEKKPETKIADYLPLKLGNSWKYEGIGNEYAAYTQEVAYESGNKFQLIVNNGGTVTANRYEVTENAIKHTFREHEFYEKRSILNTAPNLDAVILKLPLEVGNSWVSEGNNCEITDIAASVQVLAGSFKDCVVVKVTYKDSGNSSFFYYNKGVGLIKSEYRMPGQDSVISQLIEYSLK